MKRIISLTALIFCIASSQYSIVNATAWRTVKSAAPPYSSRLQSEREYKIRPKDVLEIRIDGADCILSPNFEVDERGKIDAPLVGEVHAADNTADELAQELTTRLKRYLKNPKAWVRVSQRRT